MSRIISKVLETLDESKETTIYKDTDRYFREIEQNSIHTYHSLTLSIPVTIRIFYGMNQPLPETITIRTWSGSYTLCLIADSLVTHNSIVMVFQTIG
jgi:hypothetical protein